MQSRARALETWPSSREIGPSAYGIGDQEPRGRMCMCTLSHRTGSVCTCLPVPLQWGGSARCIRPPVVGGQSVLCVRDCVSRVRGGCITATRPHLRMLEHDRHAWLCSCDQNTRCRKGSNQHRLRRPLRGALIGVQSSPNNRNATGRRLLHTCSLLLLPLFLRHGTPSGFLGLAAHNLRPIAPWVAREHRGNCRCRRLRTEPLHR